MIKSKLYLVFHLLRPTFYAISPTISRISDLLSLVMSYWFIGTGISQYIIKFTLILVLFFCIQLASISFQIYVYGGIFSDLITLSYSIIAIGALLLGSISTKNQNIEKTLFMLIMIGAILAIIQEHSGIMGEKLSSLYNTRALTVVGRFGGYSYTHTEHAAFCALAIALIRSIDFKSPIIVLFYINILVYSSLIPLSKAGIILVAFVLLMSVRLKYRLGFVFLIMTALYLNLQYIQENFSYIYYGFDALLKLNSSDGSIGPRLNDWYVASESLTRSGWSFLIGSGPSRLLERSYIEITSANILYRWGSLGFIFYYSIFVFTALKCRIVNPGFSNFLIGVMIVDSMANFTESVKLFPVIYFLCGRYLLMHRLRRLTA